MRVLSLVRESLLTIVDDYHRYKELYKPVVADSKALACSATDQEFSMVWRRRVFFVGSSGESVGQDSRNRCNLRQVELKERC